MKPLFIRRLIALTALVAQLVVLRESFAQPASALLPAKRTSVTSVVVSPDGKWLAAGVSHLNLQNETTGYIPEGVEIKLWNLEDGSVKWVGKSRANAGAMLNFSPDGKRLLSSAVLVPITGNSIAHITTETIVWDVTTGAKLCEPEVSTDEAVSISNFVGDGLQLAGYRINIGAPADKMGVRDSWLQVWDAQTGKHLRSLSEQATFGFLVQGAVDGKGMVALEYEQRSIENAPVTVKVWTLPEFQLQRRVELKTGTVPRFALAPEGNRLAVLLYREVQWIIEFVDLASGDKMELEPLVDESARIHAMKFSADGTRFMGVGTVNLDNEFKQGQIWFWNALTGSLERTIDTGLIEEGQGYMPTLAPDDKHFLVSKGGGKIELRRLDDNHLIRLFA